MTFLANAPAVAELRGNCNRCGSCCTADVDGVPVVCDNLHTFGFTKIGRPEATQCRVYERRYDNMPIIMRSFDGTVLLHAVCRKGPAETPIIVARGLGRGCSLTVEGA